MAADPIILTFLLFGVLLLLGVPIGLCMIASGGLFVAIDVGTHSTLASLLFAGLDVTPILAIPFFILAAEILARGGAIQQLVRAVEAFIGHWPGGLPLVTVVSTMIFAAICGSSIATAAAMSVAVLPELEKRGYPRRLSIGLIAASGGLGILIPPSVPLIIYGLVTGVSIGKLFEAAIVPGLLLGGLICVYVIWETRGLQDKLRPRASAGERRQALVDALPVMGLPILILGSIYGGILTPTEASGVAVVYSLVITARNMYRKGGRAFRDVIVGSSAMSAGILIMVAGAAVFGYALTASGVPQQVVNWIFGLDLSAMHFLVLVNLLLLGLGMIMEVIAVILIVVPILFPLVLKLGIDPVQFGIILVINMEIAVLTPPVGLNLFVLSSVGRVPISVVFRSVAPYLGLILIALITVTYFPQFSIPWREFFR